MRPFLTVAAVALAVVDWPSAHVRFPIVTVPLFVVAALGALALQLPALRRLGEPATVALAATAMLAGSAVEPLARHSLGAVTLPYLVAVAVGATVVSRSVAVVVALAGGALAATVTVLAPDSPSDPATAHWWLALVVALPVYIGIAQRDRRQAVRSAREAAEQARRAADSEAREAALLERNRIAQEIHDLLGHSLSAIKLQLDLAETQLEHRHLDEGTRAVGRAREIAVTGISDTRRAVHALHETEEPLDETLQRLAHHAMCSLEVVGPPAALEPRITHAVIRCAQEALTNASKHAPGAPCRMRLVVDDYLVALTVTNSHATGETDTALAGGTGAGLTGMRERATELGGHLHAAPTADGGWIVILEVPR